MVWADSNSWIGLYFSIIPSSFRRVCLFLEKIFLCFLQVQVSVFRRKAFIVIPELQSLKTIMHRFSCCQGTGFRSWFVISWGWSILYVSGNDIWSVFYTLTLVNDFLCKLDDFFSLFLFWIWIDLETLIFLALMSFYSNLNGRQKIMTSCTHSCHNITASPLYQIQIQRTRDKSIHFTIK